MKVDIACVCPHYICYRQMVHLRRRDKDIDIIPIDKGAFNFRVNGSNRKTQDVAGCKNMLHVEYVPGLMV